ncbi:putative disease resistance RPP13-like protein 3 [Camellia sinensis]|uniref:putative disease resistance RPP13-like protein 3 n=1 Tax=Camellia sinensis TaxID=4442 RepID=UPI001035F889|nr:putative disease resistance RPP13-like protein 3 [Camellia sinensis]
MVEEEIIVGFDEKALNIKKKIDMLLDILHFINVLFTDEDKNMNNEKLGEKLYRHFKGKRYLIVIDDLWDIGAWVDLKVYLPNDHNGSRVIFTSRVKAMAMHASPNCHPHCQYFLTEEESWELLQRKVFQNGSCPA